MVIRRWVYLGILSGTVSLVHDVCKVVMIGGDKQSEVWREEQLLNDARLNWLWMETEMEPCW